jgi:alpha-ribazole phosphatase
MALYAMRHPPAEVPPGICCGRLDLPLRAGWEDLADRAAEELRRLAEGGSKQWKLVASPSLRCLGPARYIAAKNSWPLIEEEDLQEMDFGDWEGQSYDRLWERNEDYRYWCAHYKTAPVPGGEGIPRFIERVSRVLEKYCSVRPLFITHAGVMRMFRVLEQDISLNSAMEWKVPCGRVIEINGEGIHERRN